MTSFKDIFNMITIINTTNRPLLLTSDTIIHSFPFFKEEMVEVTPAMVRHSFKELDATVIIVKDKAIAVKAHVDCPSADIYILAKGTHCVTLAYTGTNGVSKEKQVIEDYALCTTQMINWN